MLLVFRKLAVSKASPLSSHIPLAGLRYLATSASPSLLSSSPSGAPAHFLSWFYCCTISAGKDKCVVIDLPPRNYWLQSCCLCRRLSFCFSKMYGCKQVYNGAFVCTDVPLYTHIFKCECKGWVEGAESSRLFGLKVTGGPKTDQNRLNWAE